MYKVKVLRKFCDESGITHPCFIRDEDGRLIYEKGRTVNVIKEMDEDVAIFGSSIGAVQILEKPKPKAKPKTKKAQ